MVANQGICNRPLLAAAQQLCISFHFFMLVGEQHWQERATLAAN